MKNNQVVVYIMLVIRSVIYGSSVLFTGSLLESTGVFDVLALRFLISAVTFSVLVLARVIHISFKGKSFGILLAAAIFEPVGYFIFETFGIGDTSASLIGIISAVTPVFVIILEKIFLREKTTITQKMFMMFSILGIIFITVMQNGVSGLSSIRGIILLLAAHLSGAMFIVCSRKSSQQFTTMEITFFSAIVGAVVFNAINIIYHVRLGTMGDYFKPMYNQENLVGLLFLSLLSTIAATAMNNYGLSRIQASSVSALGGLSTIVTVILGILVNNDVIHWYHLIGGLLILTGGIGVNYLAHINKQKAYA